MNHHMVAAAFGEFVRPVVAGGENAAETAAPDRAAAAGRHRCTGRSDDSRGQNLYSKFLLKAKRANPPPHRTQAEE